MAHFDYQKLLIDTEMSVFEAMGRLDEAGQRILFLAPGGRLTGVLADSDVRRYILRGGDLNGPVANAANHKPKTLPVEHRAQAQDFLRRHAIDALPLVDADGLVQDIVLANTQGLIPATQALDLPVVIMAGGLGTRLYPYTKILPKPLIPVGDSPILELVIGRFHRFGCRRFILLVNYKKNMIKSYFSEIERDYELEYVEEDQPLGTGGGLHLLKGQLDTPFFLTNCDVLIDADYADILKQHRKAGNEITMVCAMKHYTIPYGVVELDDTGGLKNIQEKPAMNFMTNTGMYLVQPSVLNHIEPGKSQGFPDIIAARMAAGGRTGVYPVSDGSWMDMGQLEELEDVRRRLQQEN